MITVYSTVNDRPDMISGQAATIRRLHPDARIVCVAGRRLASQIAASAAAAGCESVTCPAAGHYKTVEWISHNVTPGTAWAIVEEDMFLLEPLTIDCPKASAYGITGSATDGMVYPGLVTSTGEMEPLAASQWLLNADRTRWCGYWPIDALEPGDLVAGVPVPAEPFAAPLQRIGPFLHYHISRIPIAEKDEFVDAVLDALQ